LLELRLRLDQQLVDHALDGHLRIERRELDDGVEAVAELRARTAADRLHAIGCCGPAW
jgi:hypothetical protein